VLSQTPLGSFAAGRGGEREEGRGRRGGKEEREGWTPVID